MTPDNPPVELSNGAVMRPRSVDYISTVNTDGIAPSIEVFGTAGWQREFTFPHVAAAEAFREEVIDRIMGMPTSMLRLSTSSPDVFDRLRDNVNKPASANRHLYKFNTATQVSSFIHGYESARSGVPRDLTMNSIEWNMGHQFYLHELTLAATPKKRKRNKTT